MGPLDYAVMKHAFATHSTLGRLCDESVYQHDLARRLNETGILAELEVPVVLTFRHYQMTMKMDLLIERQAIYELKTVETLTSTHEAQCVAYLYMTDSTRAKLVNFRSQSVESRFVNTSRATSERRQFDLDRIEFSGDSEWVNTVAELIADWGTGLHPGVYRKALLHCASDEMSGEHMVPMTVDGKPIGNQRFHLLSPDTALHITTYSEVTRAHAIDVQKLISTSPLKRLHWVNITHGQVKVTTVGK